MLRFLPAPGRAVIALLAMALAAVAPTPARAKPAPLRVLILTGANNHDWKSTTPVMKDILERTGRFRVTVTENPAECDLSTFRQYDALVDNYNGPLRWGEKTEAALLAYVKGGGGFVVIHAADNAFSDWPEFLPLIGGAWRGGSGHGKYYRYVVHLVDTAHPITRGMTDFLNAPDELYHRLEMAKDLHLLATAYSATEMGGTGRDEPMVWTVDYGEGRMCQIAMGHGAESMRGIGFTVLLTRGTEWAATGKVTLPAHAGALRATLLSAPDSKVRTAAKAEFLREGAAAIPELMEGYAGEDEAGRTAIHSTLDWLVRHLAREPEDQTAVTAALLPWAGTVQPVEVRRMAAESLGYAGDPEAVPTLAPLLNDTELRETALEALQRIPGPEATEAIIRASRTATDRWQFSVLNALGQRGPEGVRPLMAAARDPDEKVRVFALMLLGNVGDLAAAPLLLERMQNGTAREKEMAHISYMRLARAEAARRNVESAREMFSRALTLATTQNGLQQAVAGLWQADGHTFAVLRPYLLVGDDRVRAAAAAVAGRGLPPADLTTLPGLLARTKPSVKIAALSALFFRREPEVGALLDWGLQDADETVRVGAMRAISEETDETAARNALDRAQKDSSEVVRQAAVDARLNLAEGELRRSERAAAGGDYELCLDQAFTDGQRVLALDGLASAPRAEAAPKIRPLLDSRFPEIGRAARAAYLSAGESLAIAGQRDAAIAVYREVLDRSAGDRTAVRAASDLRALGVDIDVAAVQGFVTQWWLVGPFPSPNKSAFSQSYFPEQEIDLSKTYTLDGKQYAWQPYHTEDVQGILPLDKIFSPSDNMAAYAYAEISVPAAQEVLIKIGSDDDVQCWLNGKQVLSHPGDRGLTVDADVVKAHLEQGTNRLLLKVLNGGGDWQACLRITDAASHPVAFTMKQP
jgi:type 1 glutamine amidotransferase/HEAT repeat protein